MPFKNPTKKQAYHREAGRRWSAKERARRIAAKQCIFCRTPVTKFQACTPCREHRHELYFRVIRAQRQAKAGRCGDCQGPCVRVGAKRCGSCNARNANAVRWSRTRQESAA